MKVIITLLLLMFCHPLFAQTGEIYGNIKAKSLTMTSISIEIYKDDAVTLVKSTPIDKNGNYRLKKIGKGKYKLKVYAVIDKKRTQIGNPITVYSYQDPVRCNLQVEKVNKTYTLKRI